MPDDMKENDISPRQLLRLQQRQNRDMMKIFLPKKLWQKD
jgi:hypothetical protein